MPYIAKQLVCTPKFIAHTGQRCDRCPPELLKILVKDGLVEYDGDPDLPMDGLSDLFVDALTPLSRSELTQVFRLNQLQQFGIPKNSWSDEMFRQWIRDIVPNVNDLILPEMEMPNVEGAAL